MGAKRTIAIVNKSSYRNLVSKEIDIVVSPEDVTIGSLLASVRTSDIVNVHQLATGDAEAMEIIVHGDAKTSKLVGKKISELKNPNFLNEVIFAFDIINLGSSIPIPHGPKSFIQYASSKVQPAIVRIAAATYETLGIPCFIN